MTMCGYEYGSMLMSGLLGIILWQPNAPVLVAVAETAGASLFVGLSFYVWSYAVNAFLARLLKNGEVLLLCSALASPLTLNAVWSLPGVGWLVYLEADTRRPLLSAEPGFQTAACAAVMAWAIILNYLTGSKRLLGIWPDVWAKAAVCEVVQVGAVMSLLACLAALQIAFPIAAP